MHGVWRGNPLPSESQQVDRLLLLFSSAFLLALYTTQERHAACSGLGRRRAGLEALEQPFINIRPNNARKLESSPCRRELDFHRYDRSRQLTRGRSEMKGKDMDMGSGTQGRAKVLRRQRAAGRGQSASAKGKRKRQGRRKGGNHCRKFNSFLKPPQTAQNAAPAKPGTRAQKARAASTLTLQPLVPRVRESAREDADLGPSPTETKREGAFGKSPREGYASEGTEKEGKRGDSRSPPPAASQLRSTLANDPPYPPP